MKATVQAAVSGCWCSLGPTVTKPSDRGGLLGRAAGFKAGERVNPQRRRSLRVPDDPPRRRARPQCHPAPEGPEIHRSSAAAPWPRDERDGLTGGHPAGAAGP